MSKQAFFPMMTEGFSDMIALHFTVDVTNNAAGIQLNREFSDLS